MGAFFLIAEPAHLGYPPSTLFFASIIALTYSVYRFLTLDGVLAFWIVYIMTRPLGASRGDLLSQPVSVGGLGFGTAGTSIVFLTTITGLVILLSKRRNPAD